MQCFKRYVSHVDSDDYDDDDYDDDDYDDDENYIMMMMIINNNNAYDNYYCYLIASWYKWFDCIVV